MASTHVFRPPLRWLYALIGAFALSVLIFFYHDAVSPSPHRAIDGENSILGSDVATDHYTANTTSSTKTKKNAIIASVQKKDETTADWIIDLLPNWEPVVYVTDRTPSEPPSGPVSRVRPLPLAVNQGREAAVYLTYIVDHYYDLPEYMVFIHGQRYQIHNDDPMFDSFPTIDRLNLDYVTELGYASLKCNLVYCPKPAVVPEVGHEDGYWEISGLYAAAWGEFFSNETLPDGVVCPCCAQFAVTRETVQRWPVEKYEQIRRWLWRYDNNPLTSMNGGLVLEYMWHIIFGKPNTYCPSAKECYCKKWGLCDLECEREEWCLGRNWLNPEKPLWLGLPPPIPSGWPEQGQGHEGSVYPYEGWWNDPEVVKNH